MAEHVRLASPAPRDAWTSLLRSADQPLAFQTPEWTDCLCEAGRFRDASRLYETSDGHRLLVPMVRRSALPGRLSVEASLPYGWGFGGILASDRLEASDVSGVLADLAGAGTLRTSIRPNPLLAPVWREGAPSGLTPVSRTAHVLDLEGGFEEVWQHRFRGEARTAVRKARKSEVTVTSDTSGALMSTFHELYMKSVNRWAAQAREPLWLARRRAALREPLSKLRSVAKHLGEACCVWAAWLQNRPAAAVIVVRQGRSASYWRGAMDVDLASPVRANDLLHAAAIEDACRAGCRYYHMGESGSSKSLAQFKERFGARPHDYLEYRLERLPLTAAAERVRRRFT